jgi:hypothetical protein
MREDNFLPFTCSALLSFVGRLLCSDNKIEVKRFADVSDTALQGNSSSSVKDSYNSGAA